MKSYRIGITDLVSFLYRSGDLSSETFQNVSMLEGTKAHQYVQSQYQTEDQDEVFIQYTVQNDLYEMILSGRIDGVLKRDEILILEEIKSTRKNIFDETFKINPEHHAQLKMYAYMYMKQHHLTDIHTRICYIQISDYQLKYFDEIMDVDLLESFFNDTIIKYLEWLDMLDVYYEEKKQSITQMIFPFDNYRRGQREMMAAVYQTMMENDILYAIAPTGIGKTMAALFSTLKSMYDQKDKVFYLTAKTQGKKVALHSMEILIEGGLKSKTIEITSKDSICFLEKRECDPEKCPYAKGFFDRLTEATKDIFLNETIIKKETLEFYAKKHMVCPFEYSLDVSLYADVIICDYNYAFDPRIHLIRYFDDVTFKPKILVDEAHNMVSRSRDMYSATLKKSRIIELRRASNKLKPTIKSGIKKVLDAFSSYEEKLTDLMMSYDDIDSNFLESIRYLMKKIENSIKETPKYERKSDVMEGYLELLSFIRIYEFYGETYVTNIIRHEDDDISVTLQCLDASTYILDTLENKSYGTIFFSATLYPIDYYMKLLSKGKGETLKIQSPFPKENLKIILMNDISTRYQDRIQSIDQVKEIILYTIQSKIGNYIAFFPSYQYLNMIYQELPNHVKEHVIIQERDMDHLKRDFTLNQFKNNKEHSQLGLFVMGGMFSEGIDYIGDMLHGVIVVGVGLPMINPTNHQLKDYYQKAFQQGFDYAYTYPGMNKVIQAVGRVIRSHDDHGVAILIDDRFQTAKYKKLFPNEWQVFDVIKKPKDIIPRLDLFWNNVKRGKKYDSTL